MKLNYIKHLALCLGLALTLCATAFASPVPDNLVVENLNGQQRMVKTYVLPPETDPETLKEPSFEYDGFSYAWAYTTKEEHTFLETKPVTETVTVETAKKDLNVVLEQLAPTIPYDDGELTGELALDHTTLSTVAAGYANRSGRVTATKTIGPLDRNDMSYIPATTVKDGRTLTLANVEWQVIGTDVVGDVMAPCSYQAIATYSASTSYQVATGYVTTAEYKGEVVSQGVDSVTYTVVYVGTEIVPEEPEPVEPTAPSFALPMGIIGGVLLAVLLAALAGGGAWLFLHRKNVYIYVPGDGPRDYKLIAKFRVKPTDSGVDIMDVEPYPEDVVAVEIKRPLAKKLLGKEFIIHHRMDYHSYTVSRAKPSDWHVFRLSEDHNLDINEEDAI